MSANPYENMSAFADEPPVKDPRVAFWSKPKSWPNDTEEFEFLGRVVLNAGREIVGEQWNDKDPAVSYALPLAPILSRWESSKNIDRAVNILREIDPVFSGRYREHHCFPSDAEWAAAHLHDQNRFRADAAAMMRFLTVQFRLTDAFRTGAVVTAERDHWGGEITPLPQHFWNGEHTDWRFDTCRFDPLRPHSPPPPFSGHGRWIFVDRKTLYAQPRSPVGADEAEKAQKAVAAGIEKKRKNGAGAKRKSAWDELIGRFLFIQHDEGLPTNPNFSEIARRLLDWAAEQGIEDGVPGQKVLAEAIATWCRGLKGN